MCVCAVLRVTSHAPVTNEHGPPPEPLFGTQLSPSALVCLIPVACCFGELSNANINSTASPFWGSQDRQVIYQTLLKIVLQPLALSLDAV